MVLFVAAFNKLDVEIVNAFPIKVYTEKGGVGDEYLSKFHTGKVPALETADAKSGSGRWETIKIIDPNDPEHKNLIEKRIHKEEYEGQDLWMDMVAAEERRLKARKEAEKDQAGSK